MTNLRHQELEDALSTRILIMDGAMGTMLQERNPTASDFGGAHLENCNENLCRTRPEWILDIHRAYLEAGADIIETNSFQGSPIVLAEFNLEDQTHELNVLAAKLARQAADEFATTSKPRFVAGSLGPTTKSITLRGDVTFQQLVDSYYAQAQGLMEGGVDILLLETGFDTRNVKAGIFAIRKLERDLGIHIPKMVSGTIERWGAMLAGQPVDAFCASVSHGDLLSIGLNCATGPDLMTDHIRTLARIASTRISCYPNAGLPNEEDKYLETPEMLAGQLEKFVDHGWLNIVGGCCGTTAEHIRAIAQMAEGKAPHVVNPPSHRTYYSGIDLVEAEDGNRPLIVGERTNVIGSRLFKNLIAAEKWEEASEIARWQVKNGAHILDVCLQSSDREELGDIDPFYAKLMPKIKAPVMVDTTDPKALERALTWCQGKSILNSVNLEDGEEKFELRLPHRQSLRSRSGCRHHRRRQATGAGLHPRTQARRRAALRRSADRKVRDPARRHHHRPAGFPVRDRRRKLHRRRGRDHRSHSPDQSEHSVRQDHPRRLQHLLRTARRRARSGELRLPLSRDQGGARPRHRQRRATRTLRLHSRRRTASRGGSALQHAARRIRR